MNEIVEDSTYRWYFVACKEDLCNGGSGKASDGDNSGSLGDKSTILVPGKGNGGSTIKISILLIVMLLIIQLQTCVTI